MPRPFGVRVGARGRGGHGIVNAPELQAAAVEALAAVADQLEPAAPGERPTPGDRLDVRGTDLSRALGCPVATALDGEEPFEERAGLAGWGATSAALRLILTGHADPNRARRPTDPATAYRVALREPDPDWPFTWLASADKADRAAVAAEVHRRAAAVARLFDPWPPPDVRHVGLRSSWTFPGRPLRLVGRADLVLGRRDGSHTIVVSLGGDHSAHTRARLAFEAVVEALSLRRPPATVLGLLPDAGRRWAVEVDDALLRDGVAVAAEAARVVLGRRRRDPTGLARRPGTRCRACPHGAGCPEGEQWLIGAGSRAFGFLPRDPG